jgi:hypothetical protein
MLRYKTSRATACRRSAGTRFALARTARRDPDLGSSRADSEAFMAIHLG